MLSLLRKIALEVLEKPLPELRLETPIAELGIDSVSIAEIVTRIEDELGLEIPAVQWLQVHTFQEFIDVIEQARQSSARAR
jgi:acyl carrier protein